MKWREFNEEILEETETNEEIVEIDDDKAIAEWIERKNEESENRNSEIVESIDEDQIEDLGAVNENRRLSQVEKEKIMEETGWSDEVTDSIRSVEEYAVYEEAGLQEMEINERKCLVRSDIDPDQKDDFGRTNKERMLDGLAPITEGEETVELHHIGQKSESPLAELMTSEHRGKGNDTILHDKMKETEINRNEFAREREHHWEERANHFDREENKGA